LRSFEPFYECALKGACLDHLLMESTRTSESHLGRRTALTFPLAPPPQKN
jgi:hypothetical protein